MNTLHFSGRFVADPELKETNGNKYTFFTLAQDVHLKDGKSKAIFIPFTAFGQTAESICKFFKKGQPILVDAYMSSSTTEGDGKDTKITRVSQIVNRWEFMSANPNADKGSATTTKSAHVDSTPTASDDLPF